MKKMLYITLLCAALLCAPLALAQQNDRDERRLSIIEQIFPFLQNNSTSTQHSDESERANEGKIEEQEPQTATSTPATPPNEEEEPTPAPQTPPSNPPAQTPSEAPVTPSIPTPTPTTTTPLNAYSSSTTPPIASAVSSTPTLGAGGIYSTGGLSSDTTRFLLALSLAMGIGGFLLAQPRRGRMQELLLHSPRRATSA